MAKKTKKEAPAVVDTDTTSEIPIEPIGPEPEAEQELCQCGSGFLSQGATLCKVCKALADRDKKRAKAKLKAKARKKLRKNPDTEADELVDELLNRCVEELRKGRDWTPDRIAYVKKQIAWKLNESIPKAGPVEVKPSLVVSGTGNAGGGAYEINVA